MLSNEDISERNGLLINFITELDLGIHIVELPHKPKFLSADYTRELSAYVNNFHLILMKGSTEEVYLDIRLKPLKNMPIEELKQSIVEWLVVYEHKRVYTICLADSNMFLTGYNHHNKLEKTNPYPVFAEYNPIIYYDLQFAENTVERFNKYDLIVR